MSPLAGEQEVIQCRIRILNSEKEAFSKGRPSPLSPTSDCPTTAKHRCTVRQSSDYVVRFPGRDWCAAKVLTRDYGAGNQHATAEFVFAVADTTTGKAFWT